MARAQTIQLLELLSSLRRDAVQLHDGWADRLNTQSCRKTARALGLVHRARAVELGRALKLLGSEPPPVPSRPSRRSWVKNTLAIVQGDRAIMRLLETSQQRIVSAYNDALGCPDSRPVRRVLERHLADERRHLAWLKYRRCEIERDSAPRARAAEPSGTEHRPPPAGRRPRQNSALEVHPMVAPESTAAAG